MVLDAAVREQLKAMGKAVWSTGHWDEVAPYIDKVGGPLLDALDIQPGMRLLDVGAGSGGNVAIPAALRGASVTASDLVSDHFEDGRRRAADAGVAIEWVEADATDLPFDDESFDRVASTFGHMFAPDQEAAAAELARVTKPGGKIGIACWTPEGLVGAMFKLQGSFMPPPPPGVMPPVLWGSVDRVTELFNPFGLELSFTKRMNIFEHADAEGYNEHMEANFGPLVTARNVLGDRWPEMKSKLNDLFAAANTAVGGALRMEGEYLQTIATKPNVPG
jgi:SAM-dependent methyltransferase